MEQKTKNTQDPVTVAKKLQTSIVSVWVRLYKILLVLVFLASLGWLGFFWNENINGARWDEQKRTEYINAQKKEVNLKEKELRAIAKEWEEKQQKYDEQYTATPDPFGLEEQITKTVTEEIVPQAPPIVTPIVPAQNNTGQ